MKNTSFALAMVALALFATFTAGCESDGGDNGSVHSADAGTGGSDATQILPETVKVCPNGEVCADGNPCTIEICSNNQCQHEVVVCNDGNVCTTESCSPADGKCVPTGTKSCDDGNPCTIDKCAGGTGKCVYTEIPCNDDGNPCTINACKPVLKGTELAGECTTTVKVCDDNNATTANQCDAYGDCVFPLKAPCNTDVGCDDNNACTVDLCAGGKCTSTSLKCSDNNVCTDDTCNPVTGTCDIKAKACNDNNACTTDSCDAAGKCVSTEAVTCDDKKDYTVDKCNPATGKCEFTLKSDLKACEADKDCNDNNPCTLETCAMQGKYCIKLPVEDLGCDAGYTCVATGTGDWDFECKKPCVADVDCKDTDICTVDEKCGQDKYCTASEKNCDDGNECTNDWCCSESSGGWCKSTGCQYSNYSSWATCDDGNACTSSDYCSGGGCTGKPFCNDGDPNTLDVCDGVTGTCKYIKQVTGCTINTQCADGNVCTSDVCTNGVCSNPGVLICNDSNACTTDTCDPIAGCKFTANTNPCNDGDPATSGDVCQGGVCKGTTTPSPQCTTNSGCNDSNACTMDTCVGGVCSYASAICIDNNACTTDSCDTATGCKFVNNTNSCNDGNACTVNDICTSGNCAPGVAASCDDANPCTTDSCNATTGCQHAVIAGCATSTETCVRWKAPAGSTATAQLFACVGTMDPSGFVDCSVVSWGNKVLDPVKGWCTQLPAGKVSKLSFKLSETTEGKPYSPDVCNDGTLCTPGVIEYSKDGGTSFTAAVDTTNSSAVLYLKSNGGGGADAILQ